MNGKIRVSVGGELPLRTNATQYERILSFETTKVIEKIRHRALLEGSSFSNLYSMILQNIRPSFVFKNDLVEQLEFKEGLQLDRETRWKRILFIRANPWNEGRVSVLMKI